MRTAFVTGACGFLGIHVAGLLLDGGWNVIAYDQSNATAGELTARGAVFVEGSITDACAVMTALPEKVDAVFHVAGNTSLWSGKNAGQTRDNVEGTRTMVQAALSKKAGRFIYTSSFAVYGFHDKVITEDTTRRAEQSKINYFISKFYAEQEVTKGIEEGLDAVILNPANIMGPYDYRSWSQLFLLIENEKLPGAPPGKASFCHVREAARAHIAAFNNGRRGQNYLLGGADVTYLELIQKIALVFGRKAPKKATAVWLLQALARLAESASHFTGKEPDLTPEKVKFFSNTLLCSSQKAIDELHYRPATIDEMIEDTRLWLITGGHLGEAGHALLDGNSTEFGYLPRAQDSARADHHEDATP